MLLLRTCWCDLFLLCAMQWCLQYDNGFLFCTGDLADQHEENSPNDGQANDGSLSNKIQSNSTNQINNATNGSFDNETKHSNKINEQSGNSSSPNSTAENVYSNEIKSLNDCLNRFKQLGVDETEFVCLKALALFRPGKLFTQLNHF